METCPKCGAPKSLRPCEEFACGAYYAGDGAWNYEECYKQRLIKANRLLDEFAAMSGDLVKLGKATGRTAQETADAVYTTWARICAKRERNEP